MTFKDFLASLAYVYIMMPDQQPIIDLAGVDWFKLPDLDPVKVVRGYLEARSQNSHDVAKHTVQLGLRFLETCELDLVAIPNDSHVLAHEFNRRLREEEYRKLGEALTKTPSLGDVLISRFQSEGIEGVLEASMGDLISTEYQEHVKKVEEGTSKVVIPGFEMLSDAIGGFNPGNVIMLMGATGFGKTNLSLNLAIRAALAFPVGYINQEMVYRDMVKRMVVIGTSSSFEEYESAKVDVEKVNEMSRLIGSNLSMTNGRPMSIEMIKAYAKKLSEKGMKILIVDYDQKIELPYDRNTPEWMALKKAVVQLETMAQELNFCVILVSQVNRDGELSASHRASFTAHTILSFEDHPDHGPLIWAKKNRHGQKDAAIQVEYNEKSAGIFEMKRITITPPKHQTIKLKPKNSVNWGNT